MAKGMDPTAETFVNVVDDSSHDEKFSPLATENCTQDVDDESEEGLPEIPVEVVLSKQKSKATIKQKECIFEFIRENPEMVTHSSTPENERNLWEDLTEKLNVLKPEKTVENWKNVWKRWESNVFKRPETSLQCLDMKLKKFLTQLRSDCDGRLVNNNNKPKKRLNVEQIENILKDIEKEKHNLHLEIDDTEIKIQKFKSFINYLENENNSRHIRMRKLNERKKYLNLKRRRIHETETEDIEVLKRQLIDINKELAESES